MNWLKTIAKVLAALGAINWGLIAINPDYNLVELLNAGQTINDIIYYVIGLSGVYLLVLVLKKLTGSR